MSVRRAFTLIELLVVISIIALLIALLLPALGKAKENAEIAWSLSQKRQLTIGWFAYQDDHDGVMVGPGTGGRAAGDWVRMETSDDQEKRFEAIRDGLLWEYLQRVEVYKTPSDPREQVERSDSMSNFLNGSDYWHSGINGDKPVSKMDALQKPGGTLVFLEELDPRSQENQGSWVLNVDPRDSRGVGGWIDWPGNILLNGNVHSFADGHAVFYRFESSSTATVREFGGPVGDGEKDLAYFIAGYVPHLKVTEGGRRGGGR